VRPWTKACLLAGTLMLALTPLGAAEAHSDAGIENETYADGVELMAKQDWKGAAKKFEKATQQKMDYAEAYDQWGLCQNNLGDFLGAVTAFKHATFTNPRLTIAWYHLGCGFENISKDAKAQDSYERALGVQPMADLKTVTLTHFRLGLLLKRLAIKKDGPKADLGPAISHLEAAVRMDGDFAEAHNELGRCYYLIGRYPEAIDQYTLAIKNYEDYAAAWSNRGVAHWADGNWDLALQDCLKAVDIDSEFAGGHYNLAEILYSHAQKLQSQDKAFVYHDEAQKAIDEYRQAAGLDPKSVDFALGLGKACRGYHDYPDAIAAYKAALKLDKKNAEAKTALLEMKKEQASFIDHLPKPTPKAE
jgi:tetratricopeptide (TPR) repeat protein